MGDSCHSGGDQHLTRVEVLPESEPWTKTGSSAQLPSWLPGNPVNVAVVGISVAPPLVVLTLSLAEHFLFAGRLCGTMPCRCCSDLRLSRGLDAQAGLESWGSL